MSLHGFQNAVRDSSTPFIDTIVPGVTVIINGSGLGAKGSDEIGRIGAKLATTGSWISDDIQQNELQIQWMLKQSA